MALRHVREQRRAEEIASIGKVAGGLVELGALGDTGRDELGDLLELRLRVDRADVGVLVERIADADRREAVLELVDERPDDRLLREQARSRAAHLALVEVDPVDDALDGLVEWRVVEDDVRRLAPELEGQRLVGAGDALRDALADLRRPGEGDLVDALMGDQRHPGLTGSRDDVDDPGWQVGLAADIGEQESAEGRGRGGLEDDSVAGGERRGDLPREHQKRKVPRDDLRGDAQRPRDASRERVLELVRPARVVPEVSRRERDVDVAALLDRLARIHRLEDREFAAALLEDPRDPEQVLGALLARQRAPRPGLRAARGTDGPVGVGGRPLRDLGHRLFRGRVHGRERPATLSGYETTSDEQPVALLDRDDVARFGGRRVLPRDRLAVPETPARRRPCGRWNDARRGVRGHARHYVTGAAATLPRILEVAGTATARGGSVPIGLSRATAATTANGTSNGSRSTVAAHPAPMAIGIRRPMPRRGKRSRRRPWRSRSAAVLGDRVGRLAVADVEVVVVAREPGRPPLADQHRIVEVDELDVSGRRRPDQVDQVPGRCPVVCAGAPVRAPCALVLVRADGPDVDVEPVLVGLVPGDVPAVLEADVTDRHPTVAARGECHGRELELADGISGPPVRPAVADAVVAQVLRGRERGVVEVPDQVAPGDETDVAV